MADHPSGRPERIEVRARRLSIERIPPIGPLTPRLREKRRDLSLIGFTVGGDFTEYDEEDRGR